jgi:hypothetical protein
MYEPPMQKEEYQAAVDELVGTPIEALMFCLGDGRTVLHDTKVGELWGDNVDKWGHIIFRRAHQNAKHLIEEGNDPLRVVCDRAKEKGILVYPTLLMQQGMGERGSDVRGSNFRFDHPEIRIGAAGDVAPDFPGFECADFKHEVLRQERFALIEETLQNYDVHGFELQLNYQPYYFHPNEVEAGIGIMTDFVRQVYEAVKKSGADRELTIRIPAPIEGCLSVGMDVVDWMKQGIVDVLIGQTYSGPELLDQMMDIRPLVNAAKGTDCRIHAAIQSNIDSDRLGQGPIEFIRAAACNYWAQGIDGLYLAHWFGNWPYGATFYEKLRELPHPEVMAAKDKHYYIMTSTGRYADPDLEPGVSKQLPIEMKEGQPATATFQIADDLPKWNKAGRVHQALLRFKVGGATELDKISFKLNGAELPDTLLRKINEMYKMKAARFRSFGYWYIFDLDEAHWPKKGENSVEVTLHKRDRDVLPGISLLNVELELKYLMGKNFHRGFVDDDLGQYMITTE